MTISPSPLLPATGQCWRRTGQGGRCDIGTLPGCWSSESETTSSRIQSSPTSLGRAELPRTDDIGSNETRAPKLLVPRAANVLAAYGCIGLH